MDSYKNMRYFVLICILIFQLFESEGALQFRSGSVYCKNKKCYFHPDVLDWRNATAVGTFNDTLLSTGWGTLDITAGASRTSQSNVDIMYAAGYLEGVFTAEEMESQFTNTFDFFSKPVQHDMVKKLKQWLTKQREWTEMMVTTRQDDNPLWRHVGYIMTQLEGLYAGYKSVRGQSTHPLDQFAIDFQNANGDVFDLPAILNRSSVPDWTKFTPDEARDYFYTSGHCSALIKLLPGFENMFMSHSTWNSYQAMNRIYKHYDLRVDDPHTASKKISFPSYPGNMESLDDMYVMDSGMVVMETTNKVLDTSLYDKVTVQSLLSWQRMRVANMMSRDGKQWAHIFKKYNSGTYNNQYMLVDLKKFKPNAPLPDGTLWIVEQIPGLVIDGDQTEILRAGYWASYNVPFYEEIYRKMGYAKFVATHGLEFSHQLAPRAKMFRRDQSKVTDMEMMKKVMRYNDFKNDPYSGGSAKWGAICPRADLNQTDPEAYGCYDSKVFDFAMAKDFKASIISGPTLGAGFDPFAWTGPFVNLSHIGLPQEYNFAFIQTEPRFH